MMGILTLTVHFITFLFLASDITIGHDQQAQVHMCHHRALKPTVGVYIEGSEELGIQSQSQESSFKPIRVHLHYDDNIETALSTDDVNNLKNVVMPGILDFVDSLKVRPLTGPVLLDRKCYDDKVYVVPRNYNVSLCSEKCEKTTCGVVVIPESHLKKCAECNGSICGFRPGSVNGHGISNTDLVIYVSVKNSNDCGDYTIAYASACQLESVYDRPIAGYINFCPTEFKKSTNRSRIETGIHELFHLLAFSPSLFPFFRERNGNPRTPRNQFGYPPSPNGHYRASENTIKKVTYQDWLTRSGQISHSVTMIATPKVIEEAKAHFGCDNVTGVELENQGGGGSVGSHWEFRVLGGDAMVSTDIGIPGVFSRISLALLEDSGWYIVDYSKSQSLSWGKQSGCDIVHGSCLAYINHQEQRNETLSPFCNVEYHSVCTADREFFGTCNLMYYPTNLDRDYQYFDSPRLGGNFNATDFCPISVPDSPLISCTDPNSRCFEAKNRYTFGTNTYVHTKLGCYQFSCTRSGVYIHYHGFRYLCTCEGEELYINTTLNGNQESVNCPSCLNLCYDQLDKCPVKERPACPGQVSSADPVLAQPADVQASCSRVTWRKPYDVPLDIITGYEIRMFDSGTGESKTKHLHPSATYYDFHSVHDATFTSVSTSNIQVRLVANDILGEFSPLKSLGCQSPKQSVYFELNGDVYSNNSVVKIAEIGVGKNALLCKTDLKDCCATVPNKAGEFIYPNGVHVSTRHFGHAFYLDKGPQQIRLNRRKGMKPTTGVYTCVIPDTSGLIQKLHMIMTDSDK